MIARVEPVVAALGGVLLPRAASEPPVLPDAPTARRWAVEELAKPEYHERKSILGRLLDWVLEQFDRVQQGVQVDGTLAAVVVAVAVLVALAVAWWVAGPVRRGSASARSSRSVLTDDDVRTAAQMRAAADAAAAAGDWGLAVVERFRAVVRDLEERAVLDERPGRTAHEAALDGGARLPEVAAALAAGGRLFDDVAYGDRTATDDDDAALRELTTRVVAARRVTATGRSTHPAVPR